LTYQANPRNVLEAVLAAGRAVPSAADGADRSDQVSAPISPRPKVAVDRAAAALLARLLSHRPACGPQIILVSGCIVTKQPSMVAGALARAGAVLVGRTLMLEFDRQAPGLFAPPPSAGPLPDAFLAGLYHYRIGSSAADANLVYGPMRAQALAALANPFRIVVIEASGPCSGASLALAPLSSCTILVVQAGLTQIGAIRNAAAAVTEAGGRVVGTVLDGVARNHTDMEFVR
jgi:hypothetical protein